MARAIDGVTLVTDSNARAIASLASVKGKRAGGKGESVVDGCAAGMDGSFLK